MSGIIRVAHDNKFRAIYNARVNACDINSALYDLLKCPFNNFSLCFFLTFPVIDLPVRPVYIKM